MSVYQKFADLQSRVRNGYGWHQVTLKPADFLEIIDALEAAEKENDKLRGLLAQGKGDCVYCGLPAADIAKCAHGFPGCSRMDDIVNAPETPKDEEIIKLRFLLSKLRDFTEQYAKIEMTDSVLYKQLGEELNGTESESTF